MVLVLSVPRAFDFDLISRCAQTAKKRGGEQKTVTCAYRQVTARVTASGREGERERKRERGRDVESGRTGARTGSERVDFEDRKRAC
eukprot:2491408-Rhodomonas_salina.1